MTYAIENLSVAILMGVYNGERYLSEQLDSIKYQTHTNWRLVISDDGSNDKTASVIEAVTSKWDGQAADIRKGPGNGFCTNFLTMACDPDIKADYFAFSDQDDVWLPHKLEVAIKHIEASGYADQPYVYCSRTYYVGEDLKPYGMSPLFVYPRTFRNALIQSIAGGNTMVFNKAAKELIEQVGVVPAVSHDWWLYQLVTGAGGYVYYDPIPQILYRQHENALIGGNSSIKDKFRRLIMAIRGEFRSWNNQNLIALNMARPYLNHSSHEILDLFIRLRDSTLKNRFRMIEVCGLYRQTWRGTISLLLAAALKKI